MFLHVCVILFTGGVSRQGEPPPPQTRENPPPPRQGEPLPPGRPPPPGRENPPPLGSENPSRPGRLPPPDRQTPPGSRLQNTVYERPVRVLLECILVIVANSCQINDIKKRQTVSIHVKKYFSRVCIVQIIRHCINKTIGKTNEQET